MTEERLEKKLDKLLQEVQAMEQTPRIQRTVQGIEAAIYWLTVDKDLGEAA